MREIELKGEIRFFQACLPPLPAGDYKVRVSQDLAGLERFADEELPFSVAGPRFSLNPADVYSQYPRAGHAGPFDNTLPHVVLTRRTTPWERSIDGRPQTMASPCPWMALLVLSPRDFPAGSEVPKVVTRTVGELLSPRSDAAAAARGTMRGPAIARNSDPPGPGPRLQRYEHEADLCNTIDLEAGLLRMILPAKHDLPFLAHVRNVDVDDKETLSYVSEGCFSVVLANRFPESALLEAEPASARPAAGQAPEAPPVAHAGKGIGAKNTALLVSLEGFDEILWDRDGEPKEAEPGPGPAGPVSVRLAVLAHWTFTCYGNNHFKVQMADLDDGPPLDFSPDDTKIVVWKVTNRWPTAVTLDRLELEKLPSANGRLQRIELDSRCIFAGGGDRPACIDGGWRGQETDRRIGKTAAGYLVFHFENEVSRNPVDYRFKAGFAGGGGVELDAGSGATGLLSLPLPRPTGTAGMETVRSAFEHGFVALNHTVRIGEKTVSWYRGPLVPLVVHKWRRYGFVPCADRALRYDYNSGMFDASYAAAWQLGRLLALQNRPFARAVYRFRREHAQRLAAKWRQERAALLEKTLRSLNSGAGRRSIQALAPGRRPAGEE